MAEKILKRSEVPEEYTWNLKDMFESDEAWLAEFEALKAYPEIIAKYQGTLGESAANLLAYFKLEDELKIRLGTLHTYASCSGDQDMSNAKYQDFRGKAMATIVAIESASAFATPEIMAIPEDTLNAFYAECPELETYRRNIYKIRRRAAHILSKEEEALLASAEEMADSADKIGGILRNADLKFPNVVDSEGNEHALTNGSFVPLEESSDRVLRKNAFEAFYGRYGDFKNTIAMTLDGEFKKRNFFAKARKYNSTREAALDHTEVPEEVYDNLIEAVHQNLDKMYKYVALRKKMLGVDELHMYDVYTPIVADAASEIGIDEAKKTVLEALEVLGKDYTDLLREGFENRWIDVYENKGKTSGAYSWGAYGVHPYMLLNYQDRLDDVFTLVHEAGHSMHTYYSDKNLPYEKAQYKIFVAEVASTVNEVLLLKHLYKQTQDKNLKKYLVKPHYQKLSGLLVSMVKAQLIVLTKIYHQNTISHLFVMEHLEKIM